VSHVGFGGFVGLGCFWDRFGCLTGASTVFWVLGSCSLWVSGFRVGPCGFVWAFLLLL
jgi:hypothetical protein